MPRGRSALDSRFRGNDRGAEGEHTGEAGMSLKESLWWFAINNVYGDALLGDVFEFFGYGCGLGNGAFGGIVMCGIRVWSQFFFLVETWSRFVSENEADGFIFEKIMIASAIVFDGMGATQV
jgi:hypothetical protein